MFLLYHFISVPPTTLALCSVVLFVSYPKLKDAWKYCTFLLDGPTWSIGDTHYLAQKGPLSPSDSCKGSFLQTEFGQQIPTAQGRPGPPELKGSKCTHRDSQPHFLRSLTQPESTSQCLNCLPSAV